MFADAKLKGIRSGAMHRFLTSSVSLCDGGGEAHRDDGEGPVAEPSQPMKQLEVVA
jgi:hypothetical protein